MSYDSPIQGIPYAVHTPCPIQSCDWAPNRPGEDRIRRHLDGHDLAEWIATVNHWFARARTAEREVERLRQQLTTARERGRR